MELYDLINNKNIALYGLGTETERTLIEWDGKYNVVGLLDGFKTEGEQFGYPIIDIKDAVKQDNVIIIVVARPGSCKAISKRIGDICKANNVELYDIRGKDLLRDTKIVYDFKAVRGYKKSDLMEQIKQFEIVSFDLFDTLIVRNVLSSADVIELLEARLEEKEINIPDFVDKRIKAEKKLSNGKAPRLANIYEDVLSDNHIENVTSNQMAELEYKTDISLLQPRKEMVDLIQTIKGMGKQIYITSESYYSQRQIEQILTACGIGGIDKLFVSCEYDVDKTSGLYEKVIDFAGSRNILHIGDDVVADVEAAMRSGIKAFQIYSSSELLDAVGGLNLTDNLQDVSDKIRIGMFIANIFNSPFQFENEEKRIHVEDAADVGYLFCAPMILDFAFWFGQQAKKLNLPNILFCARDGYLLQRFYSKIYPKAQTKYFLTSRISAIRAGVSDETDIAYIDSMKFSGEVEENLKVRFGIDAESISLEDVDIEANGLLKYKKSILDAAQVKKQNNRRYIESLSLDDKPVALFDFVAKGTSQMYIQKLIPNDIYGLYFLQLELEFMKDKGLKIQPFYTEAERDKSAIFDNYYILETLLTSPEASVDEFDHDGQPVYAGETRSERDIACVMRAQEGIIEYVDKYLRLCPWGKIKNNKKLDEIFLTLMHSVEILDKDFLELTVEDPFFNRMTDIKDVL